MPVKLPNPRDVAKAQADAINEDRALSLTVPIDRIIADSPQLDRDALLKGVEAFHAERMERIPSRTMYPEASPWIAHTLAVDRTL